MLIRFPSDKSGKQRKLSRPWHGPYRVMAHSPTNVTAVKVYFPREEPIKVHRTRVKPLPDGFMAGYYWYGGKRKGPGRPPCWVDNLLSDTPDDTTAGDHPLDCALLHPQQLSLDSDDVHCTPDQAPSGNSNDVADLPENLDPGIDESLNVSTKEEEQENTRP